MDVAGYKGKEIPQMILGNILKSTCTVFPNKFPASIPFQGFFVKDPKMAFPWNEIIHTDVTLERVDSTLF